MMELIQELKELGVQLSESYTSGSVLLLQLGDRLETYEHFFMMNSWPWPVNSHGTLQAMIDYAKAHPEQQLSLCHYG